MHITNGKFRLFSFAKAMRIYEQNKILKYWTGFTSKLKSRPADPTWTPVVIKMTAGGIKKSSGDQKKQRL